MTDPKEFNSIDELFRKSFEGLQDTPDPNGWDQPSDRVWEQVKTRIKPPSSGWSTQTISMIAAFAVIVTMGLYWFMAHPAHPAAPATTVAAAPAPVVPRPFETKEVSKTETGTEVATTARKPAKIAPAKHARNKQSAETHALPGTTDATDHHNTAGRIPAQPLPGSKATIVPNTKVKKFGMVTRILTPLQAPALKPLELPAAQSPEFLKVTPPDSPN